MKKLFMLPIMALMVFLFIIPALAEDIFANKDTVKVYAEMDKESEVLKSLKGGERVKLLSMEKEKTWAKIEITVESEKKEGFTMMEDMSETMPSKYCEHEWSDWTVSHEPTCTEAGKLTRSCSICKYEETKEVAPQGHNFGDWTVTQEPTCTAEGIKTRTCSACGVQETENIPMTEHIFGDWTVTQEPTCTAEGMKTRTCTGCGLEETETIEKTAHTFGDWTVTKAATCTEEGTRTRTCTGCGLEETETIEKTAHTFGDWTVTKAATCTEEGSRTRTCTGCGLEETETIAKTEHTFGEWKVTKAASCIEEGSRTRTCSGCGLQETQTIEKTSHDYAEWKVEKQPTCTEEGKRTSACKVCGHKETEVLAKVPHTYGKWNVTQEASCTKEGERKRTCIVCGKTETEKLNKLAHDYVEKILTEATDHSSGVRAKVCKACGRKEKEETFDPEGTMRRGDSGEGVRELQQLLADQKYLNADGVDGIFGGGTEKAIMEFQHAKNLTADGVAWPQTMRLLRHDYDDWKIITMPTRETAGERIRKCKDCDYEQHEIFELEPYFEYGRRGEDVRAAQQMLTAVGCDAGTYDGIYGRKFDEAFTAFAAEKDFTFEAGKVLPAQLDKLVNSWIETIPEENWMGDSGMASPVNLALTVTPVLDSDEAPNEESKEELKEESVEEPKAETEEDSEEGSEEDADEITWFNWSLTNMGDEESMFVAVLLQFGDEPDFRKDNIVMVLDGETLKANCGNSASGSFMASREWGEGNINFTAVAVSEATGKTWLSNIETFEVEPEEAETESIEEDMTEDMTENMTEEMTER